MAITRVKINKVTKPVQSSATLAFDPDDMEAHDFDRFEATDEDWLNEASEEEIDMEVCRQTVLELSVDLARKFEIGDITDGEFGDIIFAWAEHWIPTQKDATFDYLRSVAEQFDKHGSLTPAQAKGVLNCYVAQHRREEQKKREEAERQQPMPEDVQLHFATIDDRFAEANFKKQIADEIWHAFEYRKHIAKQVRRGTYTVVIDKETEEYRTIRIGKWQEDTRQPGHQIRWIGLLTGPNNTSDFRTIARQTDDGQFYMLAAFERNELLKSVVATILFGDQEERDSAREMYAVQSGSCSVCGRELTVPTSLYRGMGPICAGMGGY